MSDPEIRFEYGPVGRETLSAISDEVADLARDLGQRLNASVAGDAAAASSPEISLSENAAGRETIDAIAREAGAHAPTAVRPKLTTLDYDERPVDAELGGSEPETAVRRRTATRGYEERPSQGTIDALARALTASDEPARESGTELEICEMVTFIVRGSDLAPLSTDDGRRRFVEERLMRRLPVSAMDDVVRIDVTPWTVRGTLIVRVWCLLR